MAKKTPKIKAPDVMEMMGTLQRQLATLERKLDMFFVRTAEKIVPIHHPQAPQQQPGQQPHHQHQHQQQQRQRVMFKAVCADCRKDCEVPFKPAGDRPVYCKECFAKRRGGGQPKPAPAPQTPPPASSAAPAAVRAKKTRTVPKAAKRAAKKRAPTTKKKKR